MTHRRNMVRGLIAAVGSLLALVGCGVESSVTPTRPIERDVYWMLVDDPAATASAPATGAAPEAATGPATTTLSTTIPAGRYVTMAHPPGFVATSDEGISSITTATAPTDAAATSTAPTTQEAPATVPDTRPAVADAPQIFRGETPPPAPAGKKYVRMERVVDPNQTTRFAYRVNYDYLWNHAMQTVADFGYTIDRRDYRLGVIVSKPKFSAHMVEPWRPDQSTVKAAAENTMHSQRRTIRLTISKAPNPAFYEVSVQVLVDREVNTSEELGGAMSFRGTGSGYGRRGRLLQSDYLGVSNIPADAAAASQPAGTRPAQPPQWHVVGRDSALEGKVLEKLFAGL